MFATITAWGYFAAWRVLRWLPERFVYSAAYRLSDLLTKRNAPNIQRLRSNLARTQPEITALDLDLLVYKGMRSAIRYWCDTFRLPDWSLERIQNTVTVTNEHLFFALVNSGNGGIITVPHAGNYDHAAAYFCSKGAKIVTVAERLKPEALFKKFMEYRAAFGMEALPLDGRVIPTLALRIRAGCVVALAADRDLSRSGIDVRFFGAPARMPAGPAVLALRTDAPLICAMVSYTDGGIHIDFESVPMPSHGTETEKIAAIIQSSADLFAKGIAAHPEDWHMMQRIWIDGDFKERS
ncbi:MAG: phosphatidylinositol mannoside acyltransferase [Candidatus Planktophila sp.]|nr:phosphatidylinositol mannoside acyltransferase [Candidatus Planktophila sp.]